MQTSKLHENPSNYIYARALTRKIMLTQPENLGAEQQNVNPDSSRKVIAYLAITNHDCKFCEKC